MQTVGKTPSTVGVTKGPCKRWLRSLLLGSGLLLCAWSLNGWAYDFKPSEAEFLAWPKFCQVVYVRTTIGRSSRFSSLVSSGDQSVSSITGGLPFGGVGMHHYCAGMTWLSRARMTSNPRQRDAALNRARAETNYTLERVRPTHHFFPRTVVQMAQILYELGEMDGAFELLDEGIASKPSEPTAYGTKAILLLKQGDARGARLVLESGIRLSEHPTPNLHYNLGLVLLKLDEAESALVQAREAYRLGYPLPGLRRMLETRGYSVSD